MDAFLHFTGGIHFIFLKLFVVKKSIYVSFGVSNHLFSRYKFTHLILYA